MSEARVTSSESWNVSTFLELIFGGISGLRLVNVAEVLSNVRIKEKRLQCIFKSLIKHKGTKQEYLFKLFHSLKTEHTHHFCLL